ncbi:hypothetical protein DC363_00590 [Thalassorhabdomicrobium marinisediminis]|uniref:Uncharacterized protein n=1 Tax=Thalassorhabdomicrobium marinisediminis TaxID=2170577 RepID=A0A2T7G0U2_9RHOB|nr:hypothetical protein DC363_00590 [Thalassorhabdomicrobium marinisediminis]
MSKVDAGVMGCKACCKDVTEASREGETMGYWIGRGFVVAAAVVLAASFAGDLHPLATVWRCSGQWC